MGSASPLAITTVSDGHDGFTTVSGAGLYPLGLVAPDVPPLARGIERQTDLTDEVRRCSEEVGA